MLKPDLTNNLQMKSKDKISEKEVLKEYREKRDLKKSAEPFGASGYREIKKIFLKDLAIEMIP